MATAGPGRVRARGAKSRSAAGGRLRIGDDWNAITIIALSQGNPLKAIAEFVENSDRRARPHRSRITRGREQGEHYLRDPSTTADGVPQRRRRCARLPLRRHAHLRFAQAAPRRPRARAALQGEFGIGLLSFWTVGEELTMSSAGADGRAYQMRMRKARSRL